jgi:flagellar hook protein FlgE
MSLASAMNVGISGLSNNAEAITVVGNNIANVNTTGFKSGRTLFSDFLSQSIGVGQVGRGVKTQAIQNNFAQSSFETTTQVTDLALQGSSFFALKDPGTTGTLSSQSQAILSRAGAFSVDTNNYLVNTEGYQVLDTSGNPIQFPNKATSLLNVLATLQTQYNTSQTSMAAATVAATYSDPATAALTALTQALTDAQQASADAAAALLAATAIPDTLSTSAANKAINDSAAAQTTVQAAIDLANKLTSAAATATPLATKYTAAYNTFIALPVSSNAEAANSANNEAMNALVAAQDYITSLKAASDAAVAALTKAGNSLVAAGTALTAAGDAAGGGAADTAGNNAITAGTTTLGAAVDNSGIGHLGFDLSQSSNTYSIAQRDSNFATATFDGAAAQTFSKVSGIGKDGLITFVGINGDNYYYDASSAVGIPTGSASTAKIAAAQRVAVIKPPNPGGLEKMGGSLYRITKDAGVSSSGFSLSENKLNGTSDSLSSNSLELSNVDLAAELVKLIQFQRAYSGNSKTITTSDQMMQETLNLKQ